MSCLMRRRRFGKGIPDREHFLQERVFNREISLVECEKGDGELWFARAKIRGFHGVSRDNLEKVIAESAN